MSNGGDGERAGAASARMALGSALRRLRRQAGMSAEQASAAAGVPARLIGGLERGQAEVRCWDVAGLYSAYGVSDLAVRSTLLGLAYQANGAEWWHPYRDVIPGWLGYYIALEQAASLIRCYAGQAVPVLLQVPGYARAVVARQRPSAPAGELARRVELRMRRQRVLHGAAPARLWAVIDEAALRRQVTGPDVMREQLRHLIEVSEMPNVAICVLPFTAGPPPAAVGGLLAVLRMADRALSDIGYLEQLAAGSFFHRLEDVDYLRHILNQLALAAEPAGRSRRALAAILAQT